MPPGSPSPNSTDSACFTVHPIGVLRCGFSEKFGVPRQPGLAPAATGCIELNPPFADPEAVRGLSAFSHIWILFQFHQTRDRLWRPTVRPPRLGGNRRVGVFASRSPYRPNHIGQSVVALLDVATDDGVVCLTVGGIDLIDGTPILDIKPHLPYTDRIDGATGGYAAEGEPVRLPVAFSEPAAAGCREANRLHPEFEILVGQLLALDPRPAYDAVRQPEKEYAMALFGWQVRWRVTRDSFWVTSVDRQG